MSSALTEPCSLNSSLLGFRLVARAGHTGLVGAGKESIPNAAEKSPRRSFKDGKGGQLRNRVCEPFAKRNASTRYEGSA